MASYIKGCKGTYTSISQPNLMLEALHIPYNDSDFKKPNSKEQ